MLARGFVHRFCVVVEHEYAIMAPGLIDCNEASRFSSSGSGKHN